MMTRTHRLPPIHLTLREADTRTLIREVRRRAETEGDTVAQFAASVLAGAEKLRKEIRHGAA